MKDAYEQWFDELEMEAEMLMDAEDEQIRYEFREKLPEPPPSMDPVWVDESAGLLTRDNPPLPKEDGC